MNVKSLESEKKGKHAFPIKKFRDDDLTSKLFFEYSSGFISLKFNSRHNYPRLATFRASAVAAP